MSELFEKRLRFTRSLVTLLSYFNQQPGIDIAIGRDFDEANEKLRHMPGSLHYLGLANDLALYINRVYQTSTSAYAEMGAFWKRLDKANRWGGDFKKADGNHFSITFGGKS